MSNQLINMSKVRTILSLYTQGVSKSSISNKTGVSRNTVKKYIRDFISLDVSLEELLSLTDTDLEQMFVYVKPVDTSTRQEALISFFPEMEKALKRKGNTRDQQWSLYISKHPDGYRKTQFKEYYKAWSNRGKATAHIDHKAGDKMYVDYAGHKLSYQDEITGETVSVEVFLSVLGASQLAYVEASMTQQKEDFINSCENALHYYGGSPQAIVPDNLKSAVIKSSKYEPTLNETFRDFVSHYQMTALPAGPYKPTHKALVEGLVKIAYRTIYVDVNTQTYNSLEALNNAIGKALEDLNNKQLTGRPYSRRMLFDEVEKNCLQPLPLHRFEARKKHIATANKNNYVLLAEDKHFYSIPYRVIGMKVVMLYNNLVVDIYLHYELIASHKRNKRPFCYTTVDDHLASKNRFQSDWTPEKFIERAEAVGVATRDYITKILSTRQHPEQSFKTCQGVLSYASRVGSSRLNKACMRAIHYGEYSYHAIRSIIEKGLDLTELDFSEEQLKMPEHGNIRGEHYYQ